MLLEFHPVNTSVRHISNEPEKSVYEQQFASSEEVRQLRNDVVSLLACTNGPFDPFSGTPSTTCLPLPDNGKRTVSNLRLSYDGHDVTASTSLKKGLLILTHTTQTLKWSGVGFSSWTRTSEINKSSDWKKAKPDEILLGQAPPDIFVTISSVVAAELERIRTGTGPEFAETEPASPNQQSYRFGGLLRKLRKPR